MNTTRLELINLLFFGRHGALKQEAELGQRFQVDVLVTLIDGLNLSADSTDETVNYAEIYESVKGVFDGKRFNLIESCAEAIAGAILDRFVRVQDVTVRIRKPSVPVDCICDYFQAEVVRCR
ncbi:MAG: dihydroneopterin aldolase [Verrucomicrobiota bacterium]